jgi:hypothetical protein
VRVAVAGRIGRGRVEIVRFVAADDLSVHVVGDRDGARPSAADADRGQLARGAVAIGRAVGGLVGLGEARARLNRPVAPGVAVGRRGCELLGVDSADDLASLRIVILIVSSYRSNAMRVSIRRLA